MFECVGAIAFISDGLFNRFVEDSEDGSEEDVIYAVKGEFLIV